MKDRTPWAGAFQRYFGLIASIVAHISSGASMFAIKCKLIISIARARENVFLSFEAELIVFVS